MEWQADVQSDDDPTVCTHCTPCPLRKLRMRYFCCAFSQSLSASSNTAFLVDQI